MDLLCLFLLQPYYLFFSGIHKKENRLLWKSVSLLAPYYPSDHLRVIAHRPNPECIRKLKTYIHTSMSYTQRTQISQSSSILRLSGLSYLSLSSTTPPSLSQPVAPPSFRRQHQGKPTLGRIIILHYGSLQSQYTRINFYYQSLLFFHYYFRAKSVLPGDCIVN
jgi:hypothetical protein